MCPKPDPKTPPFDSGLRPEDLTSDRATPVETPWGSFAIYPTPEGFKAAQAFCPHMDGPLFEGTLTATTITCPWHLWRFDLLSGACLDSPRNEGCKTRIERLTVSVGPTGTLTLQPLST